MTTMSLTEAIIQAHKSGEIDLHEMPGSEVAIKFNCASSTVSLAKKALNVSRKTTWRKLLDAHNAGEVDLVNWPFQKIVNTFKCSHHTVSTAIEKGKIEHVYKRGPGPGDPLKKSDDSTTRAYWCTFRKRYGVFKKWGVIPERVGLTKNQWVRRNE